MNSHLTIIKTKRIEICAVCHTHYQQLFKTHKLCLQCYHDIKDGNATMIALKHRRLAHVTDGGG